MLRQLLSELASRRQRVLLRLAGEQAWAKEWLGQELAAVLEIWPALAVTRFGEPDETSQTYNQIQDRRLKQYRNLLGQECDILIFDAYEGFNPDALGALSGTIRAGGLCILVAPDDSQWQSYLDPEHKKLCTEPYKIEQIGHHYIRRLCLVLNQDDSHISISPSYETEGIETVKALANADMTDRVWPFECATESQFFAVEAIIALAKSEGPNALVLSADRGRGKSAALGLAAAKLVTDSENNTPLTILVTSPTPASVNTLFQHARRLCGVDEVTNNCIYFNDSSISFIAPDTLSLTLPYADLVLVDEAAAIPQQLLKPVIQHYRHLVFATTIHGYEGTGRGFEYKVKPAIAKQVPQYQSIHLTSPIRFGQHDALEPLVNRLLAIDVDLEAREFDQVSTAELEFHIHPKPALIDRPDELEQLFALMVNAHYRTSPGDLRYLLDGPNIQILSLTHGGSLVAAALVAIEGQLPDELCEQIWQGRRRPRGHLLPQSLMAHAGFKQAGHYSYARVVRIAVRPELQGQGLGSEMLTRLEQDYKRQGIDILCTSFGASEELLRFWQNNEYGFVRLGLKAEASSGEFSAMMAKPLRQGAQAFIEGVSRRFWRNLQIENRLRLRKRCDLPLLTEAIQDEQNTDEYQDKLDLECFAYHHRTLDSCIAAIDRIYASVSAHKTLPMLDDKLTLGLDNQALCDKYRLTGEKAVVAKLRLEARLLLGLLA